MNCGLWRSHNGRIFAQWTWFLGCFRCACGSEFCVQLFMIKPKKNLFLISFLNEVLPVLVETLSPTSKSLRFLCSSCNAKK